jgi:hypothetical protein
LPSAIFGACSPAAAQLLHPGVDSRARWRAAARANKPRAASASSSRWRRVIVMNVHTT